MKFTSTTTSWDVLNSASIKERVHVNKDGTVALFDINTKRDDALCPAQGRVIRKCVNGFHDMVVKDAGIPSNHIGDEIEDDLSDKLHGYLENKGTTLQEMYKGYLQGIADNDPGYCRNVLDKIYM